MAELDLSSDVVALTAALCDIESVSRDEGGIADAVEAALRALPHLDVTRFGHTVVARTDLGREERVVLAGHLDTVPLTDPPNLPTRREMVDGEEVLYGRGTVDMKGGVAVQLRIAHEVREPARDLTFVFYEAEEIEERYNGLKHLAADHPELLAADLAVLLEPTNAEVEGGCKGTMRVEVSTKGIAAHSARPWNGHNAIHDMHDILRRLADYEERAVEVDGLTYHEALQAVGIEGGIAGNVIPDRCTVRINYRFAPDRSGEEALAHLHSVFPEHELRVTDLAEGARPGLDRPAAQTFVEALAVPVGPKEGWTDVARFAALGIPAVNFGPGDPNLAHHDEERCPVAQLVAAEAAMLRWLA
ncbi:succinyl-diaminopimelate desuccinylase [Marihabitans asiaticum]|uniref:Succinyl-diaminopimelate desuccinylase n=1 Tax=Marihabitans asiaticum TaxID=415218 RepID=A0A560WHY6_9MICO|nr:succinyl-diaminopimelate desuccinylase [Marihabitans asiaticum]TWD17313.1 succinyldiaminopimelate desuccinylase [Marihabitans asiaticum]